MTKHDMAIIEPDGTLTDADLWDDVLGADTWPDDVDYAEVHLRDEDEAHRKAWDTRGRGQTTTFFHGTTKDHLKSILKEGLVASPARQNFPGISRNRIYVTESLESAAQWAERIAGLASRFDANGNKRKRIIPIDTVILHIVVPRRDAAKFKRDRNFESPIAAFFGDPLGRGSREYNGRIPPSWIKNVIPGDTVKGEAHHFTDDGVSFYVPLMFGSGDDLNLAADSHPLTPEDRTAIAKDAWVTRHAHGEGAATDDLARYEATLRKYVDDTPVVRFHGTMSQAADAIKREGLIARKGKGGDAWNNYEFAQGREASVFFSDQERVAILFARIAAQMNPGTSPVVVELDIPRDEYKKSVVEDERAAFSGALAEQRFDRVPKEWVKRVGAVRCPSDIPVYEYAGCHVEWHLRAEVPSSGVTVYGALIVDEPPVALAALTPDERSAIAVRAWDTRGRSQKLETVAPGLGHTHAPAEQAALLTLHETLRAESQSHEVLAVADPTTGTSMGSIIKGDAQSVELPDATIQDWIDRGAQDLIVGHTHPASGPFSYDDLQIANRMNARAGRRLVRTMVVFGSDNSWYELSLPIDDVDTPRRKGEFWEARTRAMNRASFLTDLYARDHYGAAIVTDADRSALLAAHPEIGPIHQRAFARAMTDEWVMLSKQWGLGFRYHLTSTS